MNCKLATIIEREYGFKITNIIKSDESTIGNVYIIETTKKFILKYIKIKNHVMTMKFIC